MYTLKEVCLLLDMSEHTLRYYTDQNIVPHVQRDKNNRRIFNDETLDWLRGVKYLRGLGMSIDDIREFQYLCQQDGDEAILQRLTILTKQLEKSKQELNQAQQRVKYLEDKVLREKMILEHLIPDDKNPSQKKYND